MVRRSSLSVEGELGEDVKSVIVRHERGEMLDIVAVDSVDEVERMRRAEAVFAPHKAARSASSTVVMFDPTRSFISASSMSTRWRASSASRSSTKSGVVKCT